MTERILEGTAFVYLCLSSWTDIKSRTISLPLSAAVGLAAAIVQTACGLTGIPGLLAGTWPGLFFLAAALLSRRGLGCGDAVLVTVLGLLFGAAGALSLALPALLLAGIFSAGLLVCGKAGRRTELPFAPFLLASFLTELAGGILWNHYLNGA